jgi:hypothetical protein
MVLTLWPVLSLHSTKRIEMHECLYRFLIKFKKLDLPGIGTIALHLQSSRSEFTDRIFSPPGYFFTLEKEDEIPMGKLFSWLASHSGITDSEAVIRFNEFIFDLTRRLKEGKEIHWQKVGSFQKELTGEIRFTSVKEEFRWLENVPGQKIIRNNVEHRMLVGEVEKTSTEMNKLLNSVKDEKKYSWWVWPVAIVVAIFLFLGWYFSEHGVTTVSTGNHVKISPANAPAGYKLTP